MSDDSQAIKFPINEPAPGQKKSQIDEYLDFYRGPGVQHVALLTQRHRRHRDAGCATNGVEFLRVPDSYYDAAAGARRRDRRVDRARCSSSASWSTATRRATCCSSSRKPVEDRPTLFFEIIQRKGSRGFGKGNFRALFEAIEREQALRGNL